MDFVSFQDPNLSMKLPSRYPYLALICLSFLLPSITRARTPHPCYYHVGQIASDNWIPCYSSTYSSQYSCCRIGDKCLDGSACYSMGTGVTYQFGCTDPTYNDGICPKKCNLDTTVSHWVGLVLCNGTNNTPKDKWICNHPENCNPKTCTKGRAWDEDIQKLPPTWCEDLDHSDRFVAISATTELRGAGFLPNATATESYWAANTDRYKSLPASNTASSTASATPTSTNSNHTSSDKTTTTIGIAAGLGVGIPLLLGIAAFAFFHVRRQRKKNNSPNTTDTTDLTPPFHATPTYPEDTKHTAASSQGFKAELDGTPHISSPGPSEMQDTSVVGSPYVSPLCLSATTHEGFKGGEIRKYQGPHAGSVSHEMAG